MTDTNKKLEISPDELTLISNALETQAKILRMQASAGGHGALDRLNDVKRLIATVESQSDTPNPHKPADAGLWGMMRTMGQAT